MWFGVGEKGRRLMDVRCFFQAFRIFVATRS
jgi:hypothetical protein